MMDRMVVQPNATVVSSGGERVKDCSSEELLLLAKGAVVPSTSKETDK
jgi:hypothetical protein